MRFTEPQHTLCWTAWHIFDRLFAAKYESGKLTMNEYCHLINTAMTRREAYISANRKWYQFRLRLKDRRFQKRCERLKEVLQPKRNQISLVPLKEGYLKRQLKNCNHDISNMGPPPKAIKPQFPNDRIESLKP